ncbi:MAG: RagB/SusD family nutrient uptake outer membrane protein, partial [Bacteroidales bacterium]|nr:RagB/SusD family nutrient uptake outer membrane protein [Bacteroidales bacterium]
MKTIKISAIALASVLCLAGCDSYLDMTPTDSVSEKTIWATTKSAEYSINYLYTYIWDLNSAPTAIGLTESLTDELKYTSYNYNAMCFIPSEMSYGGSVLTNTYVDAYMGYWGTLYTAIRRVNADLGYLNAYGTMESSEKARLEGELRFLRGFMYFELVKRYKDVIIYKDLGSITKDKAISTEAEGWALIKEDLAFAADNLPEQASANGRIDKGMALALTTRAMLYAKDWDAVIDAAKALSKMGYELEDNYADATAKTLAAGNKEAILQYTFDLANGLTHSFNFYYTPGGDYTVNNATGGGYGVPTQEMVESYELATGGEADWSDFHSGSTTKTPPYDKLEPRFAATILYNGASWKDRTIEPYVNGTDGWATWKTEKEPKGRTVTGYYLRKLVDESYDVNTSGSSQPFTFLRYGEVLLNYAEASIENGDEDTARDLINEIRSRVNLPDISYSGDELVEAYKHERKVELAYEGQRYWDLRRWEDSTKDYPTGLCNYQQHGFKIEKSGSDFVYT